MPAQQAATTGGGQGQQQAQKSNPIFGILRMIAMWYMFKTFFGGGQQKKLTREELFAPHFPKGTSLDMSVFLSESPSFSDFSGSKPLWQETDIQLGLAGQRSLNVTYRPSQVSPLSLHLPRPLLLDSHTARCRGLMLVQRCMRGYAGALVRHRCSCSMSTVSWPLQAVQRNGSVYLHAYFAPSGLALDPTDPFYQNSTVFGKSMGESLLQNTSWTEQF